MNASFSVLEKGIIYIDGGKIVAVRPTDAPAPSGLEDVKVIHAKGTIYPGLIELHNHLSYNILQLMPVAKQYQNRDQWGGTETYRKIISGPMNVLGQTPGYVEAIVRYVECKCLIGGVTTSQGIALFSNQGITRYYRGIVRNVENTDDADLPEASARIADVEAENAHKFFARLKKSSCLLLHLSEGTDEKARLHFEALRLPTGEWTITKALAGIHCVALKPVDFETIQENRGSMIWSPLSNLLLYGDTAKMKAAKENGVVIGIGSDWSPSGSKNLFGELKVARLFSDAQGGIFSDRALLAMATRNAAQILGWQEALGSIETGKRADFLVISGREGDPYSTFLEAPETKIIFVVINGVPRFGQASLMNKFDFKNETIRIGSSTRVLNLTQETSDPVVSKITLAEARDRLADGLHRLPKLAKDLEKPRQQPRDFGLRIAQPQWFLVLDHQEPAGIALRPHLPGPDGRATARGPAFDAAFAKSLSTLLEPLDLDALTVANDESFFDRLKSQPNLPDYIKKKLPTLFRH